MSIVSQMIFVAGILCVQQDAYLEFSAIPSGLFFSDMGVSKNRGKTPKMDGL